MGSTRFEVVTKSPVLSTVVEVRPQPADVPGVKNNLAEPEYDFLSKQPTEVVDETYKVTYSEARAAHLPFLEFTFRLLFN
jgi:hypothetical protein